MDLLRIIGLGLLTAAWCFAASPAAAEKRVALVIGNSAYQKVAKLPNPVNDATSMTGMFNSAGFDLVETRFDLVANDLRRTLRDFGARSRDDQSARFESRSVSLRKTASKRGGPITTSEFST